MTVPADFWMGMPMAVRDAVERRVTARGVVAEVIFVPEEREIFAGVVRGQGIRVCADSHREIARAVELEIRRIWGLSDDDVVPIYLRLPTAHADFSEVWDYYYRIEE